MTISREDLIQLITTLKTLEDESREYLDRVPSDISEFIFDNRYANNLGRQFDAVLKILLDNNEFAQDAVFQYLVGDESNMPIKYSTINENGIRTDYNIDCAKTLADYILAIIKFGELTS